MEKNKNLWIGVGALILVILLFYFFNKNPVLAPEVVDNQVLDTTQKTNTVLPKPTISYDQALAKYARIQFDKNCQAIPNKVTFRNNTTIMLDNRTAVPLTIKIGGTYYLKAYGFKIVTLSSNKLPEYLLVDCNNSQNVATVLLQK